MIENVSKPLSILKQFLDNRVLVIDLIAKFTITFGVILIVGGLYLMVLNLNVAPYSGQVMGNSKVEVTVINWVPGLPFSVGDLSNVGTVLAGSVYWIVGIDLLLVGLGLWVRHRFARFVAITMFAVAAFFQFVQFLLSGIVGAPTSVIELLIDVVFVYLIFSKFDAEKIVKFAK